MNEDGTKITLDGYVDDNGAPIKPVEDKD